MLEKKVDFQEEFAQKLISAIESNTAPWQRAWQENEFSMPMNSYSNNQYNSINLVNLALSGYTDPRFVTFKQINKMQEEGQENLKVRKGEKGQKVIKYNFYKQEPILNEEGQHIFDEDGKAISKAVKLENPELQVFTVFNASQIENFLPFEKQEAPTIDKAEALEKMKQVSSLSAKELAVEEQTLPGIQEFRTELATWLLATELGLPFEGSHNNTYAKDLASTIKQDPLALARACRDAEKIKNHALNMDLEKVHAMDTPIERQEQKNTQETRLYVDYIDKDKVKQLGARWNAENKYWYAPENADLSKFEQWQKPKIKNTVVNVLSPQEEFAQVLKDAGLIVDGLPILDGEKHRVPVEKNGKKNMDGCYIGYSDGLPAGSYNNFYTNEYNKWQYSKQELTTSQKESIKTEAIENKAKAQEARQAEQEHASKIAYARWKNAPSWATNEHPYLNKKQVNSYGIKVDEKENLLIPIRDIEGRIQSMQTVTPEGAKYILKNSKLHGGFHLIDPHKELGKTPIIVAEGYATSASLHEVTGQPIVTCFSSNNILAVVEDLRNKFPTQEIQIMADNDYSNNRNVGLEKAKAVAEKVKDVKVFLPKFNEEEQSKGYSDFNDLVNSQGKDKTLAQLQEQNKAYKQKNAVALAI